MAGDRNLARDIFVHDRPTGETFRASVASDGSEANGDSFFPTLSGDGGWSPSCRTPPTSSRRRPVRGQQDTPDVFVHDLVTKRTIRVAVPLTEVYSPEAISRPSISSNGKVIVFSSDLPNLVTGDSNGVTDVFAFEIQTAPWL